MKTISAQLATVLEIQGKGQFEVRNRSVVFTGTDGRSAVWGPFQSKKFAEMQVRSWRRVLKGDAA